MSERARRGAAVVATLACTLALGGCAPASPVAPAEPDASAASRPFTVVTSDAPTTLDPAGAVTGADAIVALNAFQRLMAVHPEKTELKTDAATDCLYTAPTVYQCELRPGLTFSDGSPVQASDVVFSLERARRLKVPGTGVRALDVIRRMDAVGATTVRFTLAWPDRQFGYALAAPAASIVSAQHYPADKLAPEQLPVGSGPFTLARSGERFAYTRTKAYVPSGGAGTAEPALQRVDVVVKPDAGAARQALDAGAADALWGGVDDERLATTHHRATLAAAPDARPTRPEWLAWHPTSAHRQDAALRHRVADALIPERTQASLVPPELPEAVAAFPLGGMAHASASPAASMTAAPAPPASTPTTQASIGPTLTLTYPSRSADLAALAERSRALLAGAGVRLRVTPDTPDADLVLGDDGPAVATPLGYLERYLDAPLPESATRLAQLEQTARSSPDPTARQAALAALQQQAAADLTVLPLRLRQETFYVNSTTTLASDPYGPGWQLGLWGFAR